MATSGAKGTEDNGRLEASLTLNGKKLNGWSVTAFAGHGEVRAEKDGRVVLGMGEDLTGMQWTNGAVLPKTDYEISLDAMKLDGSDFFCGLTVPVGESFCTLVLGGWGGAVVGISSIDGLDASENQTMKTIPFDKNHWYHVRMRVKKDRLEAWLDQDRIIDEDIEGKKISMRPGEIEMSAPLGIATWRTSAVVRNVEIRTGK